MNPYEPPTVNTTQFTHWDWEVSDEILFSYGLTRHYANPWLGGFFYTKHRPRIYSTYLQILLMGNPMISIILGIQFYLNQVGHRIITPWIMAALFLLLLILGTLSTWSRFKRIRRKKSLPSWEEFSYDVRSRTNVKIEPNT